MSDPKGIKVVPMGVSRYGEHYIKRQDPKGRDYFWATNDPPPQCEGKETDMSVLAEGYASLTPLHFDLTEPQLLESMLNWKLRLS